VLKLRGGFFWMMANNTCFQKQFGTCQCQPGEFWFTKDICANNGYFVNNVSVSWQPSNPPYDERLTNANIQYFKNVSWEGRVMPYPSGTDFCALTHSSSKQIRRLPQRLI